MFPRLETFLAAFAVTAIAVTVAFWAFPPELRFPEPRPEAGVSGASPVEAPVEAAPAPSSALAPPPDELSGRRTRNEPSASIVSNDSDEMWQRLPATLSLAIREKLPEASLSDEDIRVLNETIGALRESMQSLREAERTPENADRIRELMGRIEEDRRKFEKTAGMSIAEFVQRTTTVGTDNGKPEEGKTVPESPDDPGR
ncbi:MAG TPA: hypothetical protein VF827_00235 [Syntrophales bacterium]